MIQRAMKEAPATQSYSMTIAWIKKFKIFILFLSLKENEKVFMTKNNKKTIVYW